MGLMERPALMRRGHPGRRALFTTAIGAVIGGAMRVAQIFGLRPQAQLP